MNNLRLSEEDLVRILNSVWIPFPGFGHGYISGVRSVGEDDRREFILSFQPVDGSQASQMDIEEWVICSLHRRIQYIIAYLRELLVAFDTPSLHERLGTNRTHEDDYYRRLIKHLLGKQP